MDGANAYINQDVGWLFKNTVHGLSKIPWAMKARIVPYWIYSESRITDCKKVKKTNQWESVPESDRLDFAQVSFSQNWEL